MTALLTLWTRPDKGQENGTMHFHVAPLPWPTERDPGIGATLTLLEQFSKDRVLAAMSMGHNTIQGTNPPLVRNLV